MRGRLLLLSLWIGAAIACQGMFATDTPHYSAAVALTAPWDVMRLPVTDGTITFSDATTMTARHTAVTLEVAPKYADALTLAGWEKDADTSAGGIVNQTWSKATQSLAFTVMDHDGGAVVSLSILPF